MLKHIIASTIFEPPGDVRPQADHGSECSSVRENLVASSCSARSAMNHLFSHTPILCQNVLKTEAKSARKTMSDWSTILKPMLRGFSDMSANLLCLPMRTRKYFR